MLTLIGLALLFQAPVRTSVPTSAQAQASPQAPCTVEGAVYSAVGGERLKKAGVWLRGVENRRERSYDATTDQSGAFVFRSVEPGKYRLSAGRTGFARTEFGASNPGGTGSTLTLEPACAIRDLAIRLVATPVVMGRVLDRDGDPVANARLTLYGARVSGGRRQLFQAGGALSNDLGEYRIFGILPGRYYLHATYMNPMRGQAVEAGGESAVPTFYPRAADVTAAVPLELTAGQEVRSMDITLLSAHTVRVRGKLSMAGRGAHVLLSPPGGFLDHLGGTPRAMVDGEGRFEIRDVVPGTYDLIAGTNAGGKQFYARARVDAGATDIEGLNLTMIPAAEVSASLRPEEPLRLAEVANAAFRLESRAGQVPRTAQGKAQQDGSVIFKEVEAGEYDVMATNLPDDVYLAGARAGGADLVETGLDLRRGPLPGPVELTFSPAGARVSGTIFDEKQVAAPGTHAVLVPGGKQRQRPSLYRTAVTDSAGRYDIRGVAPGSYSLFAWESLDSAAYREADFLSKVETFGVSVKLERGGRETRDLKLLESR